jgi:hypothetical protein
MKLPYIPDKKIRLTKHTKHNASKRGFNHEINPSEKTHNPKNQNFTNHKRVIQARSKNK